jgi:hypothetical protein
VFVRGTAPDSEQASNSRRDDDDDQAELSDKVTPANECHCMVLNDQPNVVVVSLSKSSTQKDSGCPTSNWHGVLKKDHLLGSIEMVSHQNVTFSTST